MMSGGVTVGIDTVAFRVPVTLGEERLKKAGFMRRDVVDLASGGVVRSYWRDPKEFGLLLQYSPEYGLRVEGSWPKFLYGSNVTPVTLLEFRRACRGIGEAVGGLLGEKVEVSHAKPTRVDYVVDLHVGRSMVRSYVGAFAGLRWPRMVVSAYPSSVMHRAGDRTFRAYDKAEESKVREAEGVCRYEFQLRGAEGISRVMVDRGVKGREDVVSDLADRLLLGEAVEFQYGIVLRLLLDGLKSGDGKVRLTSGDMLELELVSKLEGNAPKAFRLSGFVRMAGLLGEEGVKKFAGERTYYRYRQELDKLGFKLDWNAMQKLWGNVALEVDLGPVLEQLERFKSENGGRFFESQVG